MCLPAAGQLDNRRRPVAIGERRRTPRRTAHPSAAPRPTQTAAARQSALPGCAARRRTTARTPRSRPRRQSWPTAAANGAVRMIDAEEREANGSGHCRKGQETGDRRQDDYPRPTYCCRCGRTIASSISTCGGSVAMSRATSAMSAARHHRLVVFAAAAARAALDHDVARMQAAAGDAVLAAFQRRRLRQPPQAVLAGGIGRGIRPHALGRDRADVDDPAALCGFIIRRAARVQRNGPRRLVLITLSQASIES